MSSRIHNPASFAAYEELVAGDVLGDLDPIEAAAHRTHASDVGDDAEVLRLEFERVAALVAAAVAEADPEPMPERLTESLQRLAGERIRVQRSRSSAGSLRPRSIDESAVIASIGPGDRSSRSGLSFAGWAGWFAAAACLAIAVSVWRPSGAGAGAMDIATLAAEMERSAGVQLASWQNEVDGVWPAPEIPGVRGRVVWSPERQEGYLRLEGLPVNDPTREQYQLWIVDAERGIEQRIDGGVFDVANTGEVVVPIDARLPVGEAFAFAITIERPGGVVVSDMSRRGPIAVVGG